MKTITTKKLAATNHRPARIKATSENHTVTISYSFSGTEHREAAVALAEKLGWVGSEWIAGHIAPGIMVWVSSKAPESDRFTIDKTEKQWRGENMLPT